MKAAGRRVRRCVICESTRKVDGNHVGGRNHIAWFTGPLCREHHDRFHVLLRQAGVDLRYTKNKLERIRRALTAVKIFEWMLLEKLKHEIQLQEKMPHERKA